MGTSCAIAAKDRKATNDEPAEMVMKLNGDERSCFLFALALLGCAGASVSQQSRSAPITNTRPSQIVVYPFAVDTSDLTLNQSIVQKAYRSMSNQDESAQQEKIARDTAQNICVQVAADLSEKGYSTVCRERGIPVVGSNLLVVDGEFTDISGHLVIGFGVGASVLDSDVNVFQKAAQGTHQI